RAIAARRAASARRRASASARRFRASTPRIASARSRLVSGRFSLRSIALTAAVWSRAICARCRRISRADMRPPRPRAALAFVRPPRRDERFLAEDEPLLARALRPDEECRFFPKAVPEKESAKRINRIRTNRWGRREKECD